MIVKHCEEGWDIVSHYAHGLLAGKIAQQLQIDLRPKFWLDTLTAIVEHDDHLLDFEEQNYLSENGMPLDFTMSCGTNSETLEHAKRVYENSLQKSHLIALLVGRHLEFLYEGLAEEYAPMKKFLENIKSDRSKQRSIYKISKSDEDHSYDILLFCDRLSLILCQDEIPEVERKLEINSTIKDKTYFINQKDDIYFIEPWCFEQDIIDVEHEYRILDQPSFDSNTALKKALEAAPIKLRYFKLRKSS